MRRNVPSPDVVSTRMIPPRSHSVPPPPPPVGDATAPMARHRGHGVHHTWPQPRPAAPPVAIHDTARCQYCGATRPPVVVNQYQGWTFGQGIGMVLASFAITLALLVAAILMVMAAGPGPSTVPQPIPPRTAT